jgi:hypothetical protein
LVSLNYRLKNNEEEEENTQTMETFDSSVQALSPLPLFHFAWPGELPPMSRVGELFHFVSVALLHTCLKVP